MVADMTTQRSRSASLTMSPPPPRKSVLKGVMGGAMQSSSSPLSQPQSSQPQSSQSSPVQIPISPVDLGVMGAHVTKRTSRLRDEWMVEDQNHDQGPGLGPGLGQGLRLDDQSSMSYSSYTSSATTSTATSAYSSPKVHPFSYTYPPLRHINHAHNSPPSTILISYSHITPTPCYCSLFPSLVVYLLSLISCCLSLVTPFYP